MIGVGVRAATSDLLKNNCDEFIFYDDLVKAEEAKRKAKKQTDTSAATAAKKASDAAKKQQASAKKSAEPVAVAKTDNQEEAKRAEAIDLVVETVEALMSEKDRDDVHASQVKSALKRRRPDFVESAFGFKGGFNKILEEAEKRGLLEIHRTGNVVAVCLPRG